MARPRLGGSTTALLMLFAVGLLATAVPPVSASTLPEDKAALLAFKESVVDTAYILSSWDEFTDPCIDQWTGVSCTCYPFFEDAATTTRVPACTPLDPATNTTYSRVLQINLGDVRITQWNTLGGTLPAAVGNLTALRVLNLKGNAFSGRIPYAWASLQSLEHLILSGNSINSTVPIFFRDLERLRYVFLDNNQLSGALPSEWCEGAWWIFDVRNNPRLCDEMPGCLYERIVTLNGTSLIDPVSDRNELFGGYCDVAPPQCRRIEDACFVRVADPPFWNDTTRATFSFPEFPSYEGGLPTSYEWCIGTTPGGGDVATWAKVEATTLTQSAQLPESESGSSQVVTQTVYVVDGQLPAGIGLRNGGTYYVSVRGKNAGGPALAIIVTSEGVTVDSTPPRLAANGAVYNTRYYSNSPVQIATDGIGVSWDAFEDPESGINSYAYQVFESQRSGTNDLAVTGRFKSKGLDERDVYMTKDLNLTAGSTYYVRVFATNNAGTETYADAPPVAVVLPGEGLVVTNSSSGLAASKVAVIVAVLVGATSAAVAVLTFYLARERYRKRHQANRKLKGQMRNLRQLLNSLSEEPEDPDKSDLKQLRKLKDVAFVITDLENSTGIASSASRAYEWVQEAHDALVRDLIAAHSGYEINTEGDAFHVAFKDVATAVHFCMEVQYQMMEVEWPKEVLRLPECKEIRGPDGRWAFRGPRVRMGIHWAAEGSVIGHLHTLTKHRIFTGPAFQVTRDLCEAANGGQVLMSHTAWERLRGNMPAASFPVVEQLGVFKLASWPDPVWVYEVVRLLGRPLSRPRKTALCGAERMVEGAGLGIVPAPAPRSARGDLAFVACRLAVESCPAGAGGADPPVPDAVHTRLYESLAAAAMQFGGFVYRLSESQGCYLLVFATTAEAVRFCHAAQALLVFSHWPAECAEWCGAEEAGADGKPLFRGPRVAMAIHESNDYSTRPVPNARPSPEPGLSLSLIDYLGPAEEGARALSEVAHGGQIVLSEAAWAAVQDNLPGQPHVISLGTHALEDPCFPQPVMLMEVMPQPLAKRSFPAPRRAVMTEPGYRNAPAAGGAELVIAHVRVVKPVAVAEAEAAKAGISDDAIISAITAYNVGLARAVRTARSLLRAHDGYECKEPEPGKLTVAFSNLDSAIRWVGALQRALLDVHWPKEVLTWEGCKEVREGMEEEDEDEILLDDEGAVVGPAQAGGGPVLWRGLPVRIGVAAGSGAYKAPLNTGRADYYGTVPNLAARLVSLAQPGQILIDGARLSTVRALQWRDDVAVLPGTDAFPESIIVTGLGQFAVKGLDDLRNVYQALPVGLQGRIFAESPALVRPIGVSRRMASMVMRRNSDNSNAAVIGSGSGAVVAANISFPSSAIASPPRALPKYIPPTGPTSSAAASRRPGIFASISRNGSMTAHQSGRRSGFGSGLLRTTSRISDSSDGNAALAGGALVASAAGGIRSSALSVSGTSSAGGGGGGGWLARRLLGSKSARPGTRTSIDGGPPSSSAVTPRSQSTTGPSVAVNMPVDTATGHHTLSNQGAGGGGTFIVGSYQSDSGLSAATAAGGYIAGSRPALSQGSAGGGAGGGDIAEASRQYVQYRSLRDIADWSYPGSRTQTPTSVSKVVDHWDSALAIEAALKVDGLAIHQQDADRDNAAMMLRSLNRSIVAGEGGSGTPVMEAAERGAAAPPLFEATSPSLPRIVTTPRLSPLGTSPLRVAANAEATTSGAGSVARQIAQLFVDRRRRRQGAAADGEGARAEHDGDSSGDVSRLSPSKSAWLSGKLGLKSSTFNGGNNGTASNGEPSWDSSGAVANGSGNEVGSVSPIKKMLSRRRSVSLNE